MPEEELINNDFAIIEPNLPDDEATPPHDEELDDESFSRSQDDSFYVAVKGIFYTPKADNAGVYCVIYRGETGKVVFRELWAIRSNKEPISDVSEKWEYFIRDMNKIGTFDKDSSDKLLPLIEKSLTSNIKEYLYKNSNEPEVAASEIRKTLEKGLRYLVETKVEAEIFGEDRAEKGGILRDKASASEKNQKDDNRDLMNVINLQGIPLICQPVIDPVKGSPASKIKIGDIVNVTIQESNDIARKVMDYVRTQNKTLAFPVTLVQVLDSGNCVLFLKISDEITGVLNISPKILLKSNASDRIENLFSKLSLNPLNIGMTGGVILFIVLLLYLIARLI
ncbi:MAG: hypothetical protein FWF87_00075 [Synergistaceae bacterium]|nr:hypothetical protein [Synergistaceae bacterium]